MAIERETTTIDGIEYKLFNNDRGPAVRVLDVEVALSGDPEDGVVMLINYPSKEKAQDAYRVATEAAVRASKGIL